MNLRLLGFALIACVMLLRPTTVGAREERPEPTVYFFWSASCPYSKLARTFLQAEQAKDAALDPRDGEEDPAALRHDNRLGHVEPGAVDDEMDALGEAQRGPVVLQVLGGNAPHQPRRLQRAPALRFRGGDGPVVGL